ncbi:hypothetical protein BT69DRAFT_1284663, partial [Atractiella rhizophila]
IESLGYDTACCSRTYARYSRYGALPQQELFPYYYLDEFLCLYNMFTEYRHPSNDKLPLPSCLT